MDTIASEGSCLCDEISVVVVEDVVVPVIDAVVITLEFVLTGVSIK